MRAQYTTITGQKIAWYESKSEGYPIILIHGNSLSAESYRKQFDSELFSNYRLIALDLPGHGESSRAKDPEKDYSFQGFVSTLLEFTEKLDLQKAVFVGHSLGGNMLLDAATKLFAAKGFVIFGAPPIAIPPQMEKYFLPNPAFLLAYKADLSNEEVEVLASAFTNKKEEVPNIITDIKRTHPEMRAYLGASIKPENFSDQVKTIEKIGKPIAIFHGIDDSLVNGEYLKELNIPTLWQNKIKIIPESGHCPQLESPKEFNLMLNKFLEQIL